MQQGAGANESLAAVFGEQLIISIYKIPLSAPLQTTDWQGILFQTIHKKTHLWFGQRISVENWKGLIAPDG